MSLLKNHRVTKIQRWDFLQLYDGFAMTQQFKAQSYNDLGGSRPSLSQNLWKHEENMFLPICKGGTISLRNLIALGSDCEVLPRD